MRKYETPEINISRYGLANKVMDGYDVGDVNDNPWGDLFKDQDSSDVEANILD